MNFALNLHFLHQIVIIIELINNFDFIILFCLGIAPDEEQEGPDLATSTDSEAEGEEPEGAFFIFPVEDFIYFLASCFSRDVSISECQLVSNTFGVALGRMLEVDSSAAVRLLKLREREQWRIFSWCQRGAGTGGL